MIRKTFDQPVTFEACWAAERWCKENGISVGPSCACWPQRGLLDGDYQIAKWRNLTAQERAQCHGTMTGDMRNGPVHVSIVEREKAVEL